MYNIYLPFGHRSLNSTVALSIFDALQLKFVHASVLLRLFMVSVWWNCFICLQVMSIRTLDSHDVIIIVIDSVALFLCIFLLSTRQFFLLWRHGSFTSVCHMVSHMVSECNASCSHMVSHDVRLDVRHHLECLKTTKTCRNKSQNLYQQIFVSLLT